MTKDANILKLGKRGMKISNLRTCAVCGKVFQPLKEGQVTCSLCARNSLKKNLKDWIEQLDKEIKIIERIIIENKL